jgi:hypothetical protein
VMDGGCWMVLPIMPEILYFLVVVKNVAPSSGQCVSSS